MSIAYSYTGSNSSTTAGTSFSFSSMPIGTAATDRIVAVYFFARTGTAAATTFAVTIGGISATIVQSVAYNGNLTIAAYATVPTGTTATVAVTLNTSYLRAGVYAYALTGAEYLASNYATTGTLSTLSLTGATTANPGVTLYGSYIQSSSRTPIFTNSTRDNFIQQSSFSHGVGSRTTSSTTTDETVNWGATSDKQLFSFAFKEATPPPDPGDGVATYYINGSGGQYNPGGAWNNPSNISDGDVNTFTNNDNTNVLQVVGTAASASRTEAITKVRARIKTWSPDDGEIISAYITNRYAYEGDYNPILLEEYGEVSNGSGGSASWSSWTELSKFGSWTWENISTMMAGVFIYSPYTGNAYYAYEVQIEVTYGDSPVGNTGAFFAFF